MSTAKDRHPSAHKTKKVTFTISGPDVDALDALALLARGRPGELAAVWTRAKIRELAADREVQLLIAARQISAEADRRAVADVATRRATLRLLPGGSNG